MNSEFGSRPGNRCRKGCFVKKPAVFLLLGLLIVSPLMADPLRTLGELFPDLSANQRRRAFTQSGFNRTYLKTEEQSIVPSLDSGINLIDAVMEKNPSHIVEAILVVPYRGRTLNTLDAFNALGNIRTIQDQLFFSAKRNMDIPLFEVSTRLESEKRNNPIPDPPPALRLPSSETVYLLLKDTFFGNLFIRGDIRSDYYGLTYSLTNFKAVRFLLFTVMKVEKFSAIIYLEPLEEGMLVYCMSGVYIPDFIASTMNVSADINRRLIILINWLTGNLRMVL